MGSTVRFIEGGSSLLSVCELFFIIVLFSVIDVSDEPYRGGRLAKPRRPGFRKIASFTLSG